MQYVTGSRNTFHTITFYGNLATSPPSIFSRSRSFHTITFYGNLTIPAARASRREAFHTITFYGNSGYFQSLTLEKQLLSTRLRSTETRESPERRACAVDFPHDYVLRKPGSTSGTPGARQALSTRLRSTETSSMSMFRISPLAFHTITFYGNGFDLSAQARTLSAFPHDYVLRKLGSEECGKLCLKAFPHDYVLRKHFTFLLHLTNKVISQLLFKAFFGNPWHCTPPFINLTQKRRTHQRAWNCDNTLQNI